MIKFIKWCFRTLLVITGIIPFSRCSSGYKKEDGKITFNGKEITDKNFVVLSEAFAKDSANVYYKSRSFSYADVASFQVVDEHYAKDKNNAYYCDEYREGQNYYLTKKQTILTVSNAVTANFVSLGSGYAKDNLRAYFAGVAFKVKDVKTLKGIDNNFVKDDFQAYINRYPITGSDGKSFQTIDPYYAKDTNHIYFYNISLERDRNITALPCDKASFQILEYPFSKDKASAFYEGKKIVDAHAPTFTALGHGYSKDKDDVYYEARKITGAHAANFKLYKDSDSSLESFNYARDDNSVFFNDRVVAGADPATFKLLTLGYGSDDKHVFYKTNLVKNAQPASFKTYEHGYSETDAEDASNKYLAGKRVAMRKE